MKAKFFFCQAFGCGHIYVMVPPTIELERNLVTAWPDIQCFDCRVTTVTDWVDDVSAMRRKLERD
jgi:hypothetical protein